MRAFDFHVHVFSPKVREKREELSRRDPLFGLLYGDPKSKMVGVEEVVKAMEEEGLLGAVICGFPWKELDWCKRENDYLLEAHEKYPRLFPFVTFTLDDGGFKELERASRFGAKGAGELAPGTYGKGPLDKGLLEELFHVIRDLDLIALVHVNEPVGHFYPGKGEISLKDIELLVRTSGGVRLVLAHLGGGFLFYELMPEIRNMAKNVYYDTAALPFLYDPKVLKVALEIVPSKILFGTDYPLLGPKRYFKALEEVPLSEEEKEALLFKNALKLFGKEGEGLLWKGVGTF